MVLCPNTQRRALKGWFAILTISAALLFLIPSLSLAEWDDVTAVIRVNRTRPLYNFVDKVTFFNASLSNLSGESYSPAIRLVIDSITSPQVTVHNSDGLTPDGKPYFDFSSMLGDGLLDSGETSAARQVEFYNPARLRFNFVSKVLIETGEIPSENQPPTADAGQDATYALGFGETSITVTLDGSGSEDADGDHRTIPLVR